MRKSGYLLKLMALTVLISAAGLIATGVFLYINTNAIVRSQIDDSNNHALLSTQTLLEQILKSIDSSASRLVQTPEIMAFAEATEDEIDVTMARNYINGKLNVSSGEITANDIFLISIRNNWIVSNYGLATPSIVIPEKYSYIYEGKPPYKSTWLFSEKNDVYPSLLQSQNVDSLNLIIRIPRFDIVPTGIAVVNIRTSQIDQLISKRSALTGVVILDDAFNKIIGKDILSREPGLYEEITKNLQGAEKPSGRFRINNGRYDISYIRSDYNDWYYLNVVNMVSFNAQSRRIAVFTIIVGAVVMVFIVVVSALGAKKLYKPIQTLQEFVADSFGGGATGSVEKDEFRQINANLRKYLDSGERMQQVINEQSNELRELYTHRLFLNRLSDDEVLKRAEFIGFKPSWNWHCVFVIRMDSLSGSYFNDYDKEVAMFAINNIAVELIPPDELLNSVIISDDHVILCGCAAENMYTSKEHFYELTNLIMDNVTKILGIRINIGFSNVFLKPTDSCKSYAEALDALNYRTVTGTGAVIDISNIYPQRHLRHIFPAHIVDELLDKIRTADYDGSHALVSAFIQKAFEEPLSLQTYRISVIRFVISIIEYMQNNGFPPESILPDETAFYTKLLSLKSTKDSERWITATLIDPLIGLVEIKNSTQSKSISDRVLEFIEKEYDTNLTLEECAYRLHYNPSYVSRIFRKETGVSFKDYMLTYRLNEAKRMLSETDMKISEISERLNYNNTQNFIRYFKNIEGVTPSQYRERGKDKGKVEG